MLQLSDYFGTYAYVNPAWGAYQKRCEFGGSRALPGFPDCEIQESKKPDGTPTLIEVLEGSRLYEIVRDECDFRSVPMPAIYIDTSCEFTGGSTYGDIYTITVDEDIVSFFTDEELRFVVAHEIKHLYQPIPQTREEYFLIENDADRAGLESTDYDTAKSVFQKFYAMVYAAKIGVRPSIVHAVLPSILSSYFPFSIDINKSNITRLNFVRDNQHPSPYSRMRVMRNHAECLEQRACEHS